MSKLETSHRNVVSTLNPFISITANSYLVIKEKKTKKNRYKHKINLRRVNLQKRTFTTGIERNVKNKIETKMNSNIK